MAYTKHTDKHTNNTLCKLVYALVHIALTQNTTAPLGASLTYFLQPNFNPT